MGKNVPWVKPLHIEQDLIISRVLVEIFNHPKLSSSLAFRGGTAEIYLICGQQCLITILNRLKLLKRLKSI